VIDALQTTERPGEAFEVQWRQAIKRRVVFVLTALTLWGLVVQARLVWLQVIQHDYYVATALKQQRSRVTVAAARRYRRSPRQGARDVGGRHGNYGRSVRYRAIRRGPRRSVRGAARLLTQGKSRLR
jgi:cell division protein FtsI/penicillin-binding protein 2